MDQKQIQTNLKPQKVKKPTDQVNEEVILVIYVTHLKQLRLPNDFLCLSRNDKCIHASYYIEGAFTSHMLESGGRAKRSSMDFARISASRATSHSSLLMSYSELSLDKRRKDF